MSIKEVRGFALTKKFMFEKIVPNYPEIIQRIKNESYKNYKKTIYKPLSDDCEIKIKTINKQSVYRDVEIKANRGDKEHNSLIVPCELKLIKQYQEEKVRQKQQAENLVTENLQNHISDIQYELQEMQKVVNSTI
jgi:hypothetical protein